MLYSKTIHAGGLNLHLVTDTPRTGSLYWGACRLAIVRASVCAVELEAIADHTTFTGSGPDLEQNLDLAIGLLLSHLNTSAPATQPSAFEVHR